MWDTNEMPSPKWFEWYVRKNFAAKYYPDKNINYFCTGEDISGDEIDCREWESNDDKEYKTIKCFASPNEAILYLFKHYQSVEEQLGIEKIFVEQDNGDFIEVYKTKFTCVGPEHIFLNGYQSETFREFI
jgi:hypothetical protein